MTTLFEAGSFFALTSFPVAAALLAIVASAGSAGADAPDSLFKLTATNIDGKPQPLSAYEGEVVLVVNTASECGFTPQYAGLEKLYEDYKGKGFTILGFPSNDFGGQEPGTAAEIKSFCEKRFKVTFPMFDKVATKGSSQSPVYAFLTKDKGEPRWNFHKYLVGKDGKVIAAYPS
ncbi:MAG: glutathione peroxidase, partial [Alphaproteobacteria bacterium]